MRSGSGAINWISKIKAAVGTKTKSLLLILSVSFCIVIAVAYVRGQRLDSDSRQFVIQHLPVLVSLSDPRQLYAYLKPITVDQQHREQIASLLMRHRHQPLHFKRMTGVGGEAYLSFALNPLSLDRGAVYSATIEFAGTGDADNAGRENKTITLQAHLVLTDQGYRLTDIQVLG